MRFEYEQSFSSFWKKDEVTKDNFHNRVQSLYDLLHNDGQMLHGDFNA